MVKGSRLTALPIRLIRIRFRRVHIPTHNKHGPTSAIPAKSYTRVFESLYHFEAAFVALFKILENLWQQRCANPLRFW